MSNTKSCKSAYYELKGMMSELGADERKVINDAIADMRACIAKHGEAGTVALSILTLEAAAKEEA